MLQYIHVKTYVVVINANVVIADAEARLIGNGAWHNYSLKLYRKLYIFATVCVAYEQVLYVYFHSIIRFECECVCGALMVGNNT